MRSNRMLFFPGIVGALSAAIGAGATLRRIDESEPARDAGGSDMEASASEEPAEPCDEESLRHYGHACSGERARKRRLAQLERQRHRKEGT